MTPTSDATKATPLRVRPALRRIAIASCIILLPLAAFRLWDYIELRRLIAQIDAIRAKGEPATEQQAGRGYQPLSDEQQRAANYYFAAAVLASNIRPTRALVPIHAWLATANAADGQTAAASAEGLRTVVEASHDALSLADNAGTLAFRYLRVTAYTDTLTLDRCARTAIAIERYRRDHRGALPQSVVQLTPQYLAAVPIDPATDAPLLYRSQADAYTIYGVGRDQLDDGGDLTSPRRPDRLPWAAKTLRGRDVGLRVLIH